MLLPVPGKTVAHRSLFLLFFEHSTNLEQKQAVYTPAGVSNRGIWNVCNAVSHIPGDESGK